MERQVARAIPTSRSPHAAPLRSLTLVVEGIWDAIAVEAAHVMVPEDGSEPGIFASFRRHLPAGVVLQPMGRFQFYEAARGPDVALVIATGEQRIYANILLTLGVVLTGAS